MNYKILLAKLNAKGVDLLGVFGGSSEITKEDVCIILAGLSERVYLYARAAYCEDNECTKKIVQLVAADFAVDKNFIQGVLFDHIYPNYCRHCDAGTITHKQCKHCGGVGVKRMSDRERAKLIKRSRTYYKQKEKLYNKILDEFSEYDSAIKAHFSRKIDGGKDYEQARLGA